MDNKEKAEVAFSYWDSVFFGNPLKIVAKNSQLNTWIEVAGIVYHSNVFDEYKLVAECHVDLFLKYLNEGVVVEFKRNGDYERFTEGHSPYVWTEDPTEIREISPYEDGEVWWCYIDSSTEEYFPLIHREGKWFRGDAKDGHPLKIHLLDDFKPLYKIGELK